MISVREVRNDDDVAALLKLGSEYAAECAPNFPFAPDRVLQQGRRIIEDHVRKHFNAWIAYDEDNPIGMAVGQCNSMYFSHAVSGTLHLVFVTKSARGGWTFMKMVRQFEQWAKDNYAVRLSVGVERLDVDKTKHIRALFPKLGYEWAGSNYIKE